MNLNDAFDKRFKFIIFSEIYFCYKTIIKLNP